VIPEADIKAKVMLETYRHHQQTLINEENGC